MMLSSKARVLTLVTTSLAFVTGHAAAQTDHRAVVVVAEGPDADAVSSAIAAHIQPPDEVRDSRAFRTALSAQGAHALGPALGNRARGAQLIQHAHAAASDAHVDLALLVSIRKAGRARVAHVWVIDGHGEGAAVDKDVPLAAGASPTQEADAAWAAAAPFVPAQTSAALPAPAPIASAAPQPPASSATTAATTQSPAPTAPASADHGTESTSVGPEGTPSRATALAILAPSIEAGSRHFSYVDRLTPTLRPYDLFAAPMAAISVEVYPLARTRVAVLRGLGVTGDYARAFGIASADAGGSRVGTSWQSFDFGMRERIALGPTLLLGVDVGYGANIFDFDQPSFTAALPSADYRMLRAGVDLRGFLGSFSVFGAASWLDVLSTGGVGQLFPRESVGGLEARLGGAYAPSRSIELSLGIAYTRFFYSMNPQPGDANVAGGALDEMARLSLGFAYLL